MLIIFIFIFIYLFLLILYYTYDLITLHKIDYLCFKLLIKYRKNITNNYLTNNINLFDKMINIVKDILYLKSFDKMSECSLIPSTYTISNIKYNNINKNIRSKIFWYEFCKKHNLNHPKCYLYIKNKKLKNLNKLDTNKFYIIKPINGYQGMDIKLKKGNNILKLINKNKLNNVIVQEKLNDCYFNNKARHFRFITLYNNNLSILYELKQYLNKITSNGHTGSKIYYCLNNNCLKLSEKEKIVLNEYLIKLEYIHKKYLNNIFSLGWDLMFDCNNKYKLKIYILEANIGHTVLYDLDNKDLDNKIIKYKDLALEFYKKNNIQ